MALRFYVDHSKIHGRGMFARSALKIGRSFDVPSSKAPKDGHFVVQDPDGGYHLLYNPYGFMNHSDDPNAVLYFDGECFTLELIKSIKKDEEVVFDYEG